MSDDIQKETERIHQRIVESLSFSEALAKRDAEIERLRELSSDLMGERNECREERERLRGLLGDVQIILDSHNNIVGNLNGEIEALRGLLREAEKMWPNPGLSQESASWYRRVRKALGE